MADRRRTMTEEAELDLSSEDDRYGWDRLVRDVRGGRDAATPLVAALDAPVEPLLVGVDVEAALAAAEDPDADVRDPMRLRPDVVPSPVDAAQAG